MAKYRRTLKNLKTNEVLAEEVVDYQIEGWLGENSSSLVVKMVGDNEKFLNKNIKVSCERINE